MKKIHYWTIIVLVLIIGATTFYIKQNSQLLSAFENISLATIAYLAVVRLLFLVTNGLFLREFASKFEIQLSPKEWVGIPIVTTMGNYLTPFSGGMVARAAYLKYRHAFPYTQFATLLASNYLIVFLVVGTVGLLAMITSVGTARFSWQVTLLFAAIVIAIPALLILPISKFPGSNWLVQAINTALEGWTLIKNDYLLLGRLVIYSVINILLNGLSFWLAYAALGYQLSFTTALLISLAAVLSLLIRVTPGNLGIQEAIVSFSSELLGVGAAPGLGAALLIRVATAASVFTLGPVFSVLLTHELTSQQTTRAPDASELE